MIEEKELAEKIFHSVYFFWSYHESERGKFDFKSSGKDIQRLFDYAKETGLYVIVRSGPYCNVRGPVTTGNKLQTQSLTIPRPRQMVVDLHFGARTDAWARSERAMTSTIKPGYLL